MISVSVTGVDSVNRTLGQIPGKVDNAILLLAERIHELTVDGAQKHGGTGSLWRSLGSGPTKIANGWLIRHDLQIAKHAPFVHWGSMPHTIRPKNKKALRWAMRAGFAFAKRVNHPGYKGDPYMIKAAEQAIREFDGIISKEFKNGT